MCDPLRLSFCPFYSTRSDVIAPLPREGLTGPEFCGLLHTTNVDNPVAINAYQKKCIQAWF
jgi:hypothetical protein